jgi:hypothetical protein
MADNDDTIPAADKPAPRRRAPRKSDGPKAAKKPAARRTAPKPPAAPTPVPSEERGAGAIERATNAVGGRRNAALIAGGLAAAGAAAAALLSLRSSTPRRTEAANDTGAHAHQTDGTDSSGQMEALIADENMVPESTPTA